jgi:hypothetical protein
VSISFREFNLVTTEVLPTNSLDGHSQLSPKKIVNGFYDHQGEEVHDYIVLPELQRFYGRAIVIVTPVEMPISDINRPCQSSFSFYTCQFTIRGCTSGLNLLSVLLTFIQWYPAIKPLQLWENYSYIVYKPR